MRNLLTVALVCVLCASVSISSAQVNSQSAQVDQLLASFEQPNTPGVAVLVIHDGQIVHRKGYGLARLDTKVAIGVETAFELASVSMPFTAMAVMMLVERGELSYDDPVSKYFPEFPDYSEQVTIRHLLTHTSGIVDVISPTWMKDGPAATSKQAAAYLAKETNPKSAPGERLEYNYLGYVLLALIVEKVSGKSFPAFMRENIFKPLGMNNSLIWNESMPKIKQLAPSYVQGPDGFREGRPVGDKFVYGPKGVISTIDDLSTWIEAFWSGSLLKPETLQLALAPNKLNDGSESHYGFAWILGNEGGLPVIEHPGGYLGYHNDIKIYPTQRTAIVVLSNNAQADAQTLAKNIARIYLGQKMSAPAIN